MVKNAMLINGDYHRMHARVQSLIFDMFKKAKIWAIREPQNMFHGLVPAEILKSIVINICSKNPLLSAHKSYGMNGIDSLVVGHFGEVNKGFKQ